MINKGILRMKETATSSLQSSPANPLSQIQVPILSDNSELIVR